MKLEVQTGWLTEVIHKPSPYFNQRPERTEISLIVLHNISLPAGEFGTPYVDELFTGVLDKQASAEFAMMDTQVASHLLIDRQGVIKQYVSLYDRAWHAGISQFEGRENCNDFSIGVELEGSDYQSFEAVQYQQLQKILLLLLEQFPAISRKRIVGHSDVAPGRKTDPGPFFDWQLLDQLVKKNRYK